MEWKEGNRKKRKMKEKGREGEGGRIVKAGAPQKTKILAMPQASTITVSSESFHTVSNYFCLASCHITSVCPHLRKTCTLSLKTKTLP